MVDQERRTATWPTRVVRRLRRSARLLLEQLERRRAEAVRRRPMPLVRRLRRAGSVLILCQGNVSRSVFATQLIQAARSRTRGLVVRSAGLGTEPGWRAHPRVVARCELLSIDVRAHGSVAVTAAMVAAADIVLVMEVLQAVDVTRRFPIARRKTFLLSCLAPDVPLEIADPAGKPDPEVDACLDLVARAVKPIIEVFAARDAATA